MEDEARELQPGRDYPLWARLKLSHAQRLHTKLIHDHRMWRWSLTPETTSEYSVDRLRVTIRASIPHSPPVHEWALAFGDTIHNYRSALDALAWAMAHLDGNKPDPRNARSIYFPLKPSRSAFNKEARKRLSSVPDFVLHRMQRVQPYHMGGPDLAIANFLHDLDIQDKHRLAVEIQTIAVSDAPYRFRVFYESDADPDTRSFEEDWVAPGRRVEDGDEIVVINFSHKVRAVEVPELPLGLMVDCRGQSTDLFHLLALIDQQVEGTFQTIESGIAPDV